MAEKLKNGLKIEEIYVWKNSRGSLPSVVPSTDQSNFKQIHTEQKLKN